MISYITGGTQAENRTLRRIFWPKRDENWKWRILKNEQLHSLYLPTNIVRVIKSRRLIRTEWKMIGVLTTFNR